MPTAVRLCKLLGLGVVARFARRATGTRHNVHLSLLADVRHGDTVRIFVRAAATKTAVHLAARRDMVVRYPPRLTINAADYDTANRVLSLRLSSDLVIDAASTFKLALHSPAREPVDLGQWPVRSAFERTALVRIRVSIEDEHMLLLTPVELRIWSPRWRRAWWAIPP